MVGPETKPDSREIQSLSRSFLDRKSRNYTNVCCKVEVEAMWVVLCSKAVD